MPLEGAGRSELTEFATYHIFGNVYGNVLSSVVYGDRVTDHLREYRRTSRPRFEDGFFVLGVQRFDSFKQLGLDVRSFFNASAHILLLSSIDSLKNKLIRLILLLSRLITESGFTPRSHRTCMTDGTFALAAAVRVIARVHYGTSDGRSDTQMSGLTGFTDSDNLVVEVTDLTDSRLTFDGNVSHFAAGKFESGKSALFRHKLSSHTRASRKLSALTRLKFDIVYHSTYGDIFEGKAVADLNIRVGTRNDDVAYVKTERRENVSLFAVRIEQKRDVRRSVRIVLDGLYGCFDAVFISLEIYDTVLSLIAAAVMTNGDFTLRVSACGVSLVFEKRSFGSGAGNFFVGAYRHETARRRSRFISFNTHCLIPP